MGDLFKPVECSCHQCQAMCANSVCLPTPKEVGQLVKQGYGNRLATYQFDSNSLYQAPATVGYENKILPRTNMGACTFFKNGKCELHDLGLKPLEGRLAHHSRPWQLVRLEVIKHWKI